MDAEPVRLTRQDRRLEERLRAKNLEGVPVSAVEARKALPKRLRPEVSEDEIADALDRLAAAGLADRQGEEYLLRAKGGEAWIRISLHRARG